MQCTFTNLFWMKSVFTYVLSLHYTWITWSASWHIGRTLCWGEIVDGQLTTSGEKTTEKRLNKGTANKKQFCTQRCPPIWFIPYFTDTWIILSQSTHASSHSHIAASLLKEQRLRTVNRAILCLLLIELPSVHGCPGRSWLKQVDGKNGTGPYLGK